VATSTTPDLEKAPQLRCMLAVKFAVCHSGLITFGTSGYGNETANVKGRYRDAGFDTTLRETSWSGAPPGQLQ
jgi:hypothetical protein